MPKSVTDYLGCVSGIIPLQLNCICSCYTLRAFFSCYSLLYFVMGFPINWLCFFHFVQCLTAVGFCSTSLVSLSLVGCRAITSLELTCPFLEQVHLDGCDHLERAKFCPVSENDWMHVASDQVYFSKILDCYNLSTFIPSVSLLLCGCKLGCYFIPQIEMYIVSFIASICSYALPILVR